VFNLVCKNSITKNDIKIKGKVLQDYSFDGKERPWIKKKIQTHLLADAYFKLGYQNKAVRVDECGTYLEFKDCPNGHEGQKLLSYANFCRERLCPMCQWRRSMKLSWQVKNVCHYALLQDKSLKFIMLTLTVKNVKGDMLSDTIDNMMYAYRKLTYRKEVKRAIEGYFRVLEITYNENREDYHPHFHILLPVKERYFQGYYYISQERWTELWRKSLKVSYDPIVEVHKIRSRKGKSKVQEDQDNYLQAMEKAAAEVGKYTVKPDDYIKNNPEVTQEVVGVLTEALKGRRLVSYAGILKTAYNVLKMEDIDSDNTDLVHTTENEKECKCSVCNSDLEDYVYSWNIGAGQYIGQVKERGL